MQLLIIFLATFLLNTCGRSKMHIKNCHSAENLCHTGKLQSPILIDANKLTLQNTTEKIFKFIGFSAEQTMEFRTLNFRSTELSITSFDHGPWVQYDGKTFVLYKIRFLLKYNLKGGFHCLRNFDEMGEPIGEILMEFELCHKDPKIKEYFFISSMMVAAEAMEPRMNLNGRVVDFDDLFYGNPIPKYPIDKKPPVKEIQISLHWDRFIPNSFNGAMLYVGSFFEENCFEGITYFIFDTPISIKPGIHLTRFYSKNINLTRPIQDERPVKYYLPINIEFLERGSEDSKLCPNVRTRISKKDSTSTDTDQFGDFQDFIDEKSKEDETMLPQMPIIVGARARLTSPHSFAFLSLSVLISAMNSF